MKVPSPPVVSAALSGFVVGVLVTLVASGAWGSNGHPASSPTGTLPSPTAVGVTALYRAVDRLVLRELGPPDPGQRGARLVTLDLLPAESVLIHSEAAADLQNYRSVYLEFRLYDNPLGKAWRFRTAQSDVFRLLKTLYTSGLPIYNVELVGWFPLAYGHTLRETKALTALMDNFTATTIPWKQWGREHEGRVWNLLTYKSVDPRFG